MELTDIVFYNLIVFLILVVLCRKTLAAAITPSASSAESEWEIPQVPVARATTPTVHMKVVSLLLPILSVTCSTCPASR